MFIDKATIKIKAGDGGDGAVSFFRAKYVQNGGPDGGDGGHGGDVIFVADGGMATLMDFRYTREFKAERGRDGGKTNCSGKGGADVVVRVPVGTVIKETTSGKIMADMREKDESRVLAKGGRGGRGNQHFATSVRQAPRYAEKGKQGKSYTVTLELKLIADAGIIGFPNVGKSTLLSMVTNAVPKIADYHFTTLSPNLGVVQDKYGETFTLADIPGLIEGAADGAGLGHDFLRHIERTRVLVHVVDAASVEGGDPLENIEKINEELRAFNPELLKRPQIIAANKMDIPEAAENFEKIKGLYEPKGVKVLPISAAGNVGLQELMAAVKQTLEAYPDDIVFDEDFDESAFFAESSLESSAPFDIAVEDGVYAVSGAGVEKMVGWTNIDTEKGFAFFQKYLRDKGVIEALKQAGIQQRDTVRIYGAEFEFIE